MTKTLFIIAGANRKMKNETYKLADDITKIFARAVKKAQEENRQKGLPNVFSINGKIVYALPDGTFTTDYQFK